MNTRRSPLEQQWLYGAIRTILITYGVAAFTFLSQRTTPGIATPALRFVILGLAAQLLLFAVRLLIKRFMSDRTSAIQSLIIVELIGDGVTVLLFALGTLGAIMSAAENV